MHERMNVTWTII